MSSLVSVIIPAWNADKWIGETIRSVVGQTWTNLEVVVVDDGSADGTKGVVDAVSDSRIRFVAQSHGGASAARNRGLAESTGEYIQYLDADDLLSPNKLESQLEALRDAGGQSVASCPWVAFTDTIPVNAVAEEPVWRTSDPVEWLVRSLSGEGMMQPASWLVPRPVADAAGPWNETLSLHDDGEYFARVLVNSSRNVFVPEATVYYRSVRNSLSRRRSRSAAESAFAVCKSRHATLLAARDDAESRRAVATQYAQFAYEFCKEAPDLAVLAIDAIDDLGARPINVVGGQSFRMAVSALGFAAAQRLRSRAT